MAIQLVSLPTQTEHLVLQEDDRDVLHLHVKLTESCLKAIEKSATVSCVSNDVQLGKMSYLHLYTYVGE